MQVTTLFRLTHFIVIISQGYLNGKHIKMTTKTFRKRLALLLCGGLFVCASCRHGQKFDHVRRIYFNDKDGIECRLRAYEYIVTNGTLFSDNLAGFAIDSDHQVAKKLYHQGLNVVDLELRSPTRDNPNPYRAIKGRILLVCQMINLNDLTASVDIAAVKADLAGISHPNTKSTFLFEMELQKTNGIWQVNNSRFGGSFD
jgi:hypothetical protein